MNKTIPLIAISVGALQACVMAPPQPMVVQQPGVVVQPQPGVMVAPPPGVVVPPGVVYMAPTYPAPSIGFVWEYHPRYGWGWRHPQQGWHRGWR